ncbi:WW domain-containing protein [Mycena kentingensis (nom. inval.)]|nr:WW domain-containing protein [Mycena kentingensis (nom. inval.)]
MSPPMSATHSSPRVATPSSKAHTSPASVHSHSHSPAHAHAHPHAHSRSPPTEPPLPPNWIKQFDVASQRHFYVDTAVPRSTWSHPYEDEQYLREHGHPKKTAHAVHNGHGHQYQNIRRHSSASQGIASPVIVAQQQKAPHHHHHHQVQQQQQGGPDERERIRGRERHEHEQEGPARKRTKLTAQSPDNVPVASMREDLARELEMLLRRDFSFQGQYCHAATMASAANPGLSIKGIGIVGLPLSDRDAELVRRVAVTSSTAEPVGNTWEIEAQSVECLNPAWATYLEEIVLKTIWRKLAPDCTSLQLRLQNLSLWEQSPNLVAMDCTRQQQPELDEFASIHVILPSTYTGGHVQLSFATSSEHYELSATSSFSTSFVAWYHGVDCRVNPIESGRRLALSYRLVVSEGPRPNLPSMGEKLVDLRLFLRKWSNLQDFEADKAPYIMAYPLMHEYRDDTLRGDTLKLEDRHKVIHLKALCDELGFQLGLATLEDQICGPADESASRDPQGRPRRMLGVTSRRLNIKEVYDFDGVPIPSMTKLELQPADLVPPTDSAPDIVVYHSKSPRDIEFHYSRTVVVLFSKRRIVEMLLHTRKTSYAFERLHNIDPRVSTPVDKKIASFVLSSLYNHQPYNSEAQMRLAEIAIGWKDARLWNDTARSTPSQGTILASLEAIRWLDAWKLFSFRDIRESLERIWEKKGPHKALEFFLSVDPDVFAQVETGPALENVNRWAHDQLLRSLDGLQQLERDDVPLFISALQSKGVEFFWDAVMKPIIRVPNAYDFWMAFLRSMYSLRCDIKPNEQDTKKFEEMMDEGLDSVLSDFGMVVRSGDIPLRGRRLSEIIDLCLYARRLDMCRRVLFLTVPRDQSAEWIPIITSAEYIPLLRQTLNEHGMEVYHKPFCDFFSAVIGCYLHFVIGAYNRAERKICGTCQVCGALDDFMASPNLKEGHFVGTKQHAEHLESHLVSAPDIVLFTSYTDAATQGSTVTVVTKLRDAETDPTWGRQRRKATDFLAGIGEMKIVDRIMGRRYNDVLLAIEGKQRFVHMEDGSRAGSASAGAGGAAGGGAPTRGVAIHHLVQGRWTATSVTDEAPQPQPQQPPSR